MMLTTMKVDDDNFLDDHDNVKNVFDLTSTVSTLKYGGMYLPPYFFCHNTLFFQKILCCGSKNNVL